MLPDHRDHCKMAVVLIFPSRTAEDVRMTTHLEYDLILQSIGCARWGGCPPFLPALPPPLNLPLPHAVLKLETPAISFKFTVLLSQKRRELMCL